MDTVAIAAGQWRMVFPESLYERLRNHLFPGDGDEHGAVIAAGLARTPVGEMRLLARNLFLAADGQDYIAGKRGYKMLKAEFVRDRVMNCRDEQLVYMAIHNHGCCESVEFSGDDLQSHERGYPALLDIMRGIPVGALVFASNAIAGDIWLPGERRVKLASATIVGRCRRVLRSAPAPAYFSSDPTYDRQARLFGDAGQAILREAKVGIIGLGGIGMLLAEYLGRLGVGHFVLIEPERVAASNLPRLPGATRWDALMPLRHSKWLDRAADRWSTPKVRIATRAIRRANRSAKIRVVMRDVTEAVSAAALLDCDYLFLAADTMRARLIFNQIVQQYFIPGAQIGSKVSTDPVNGAVTAVFSMVRPVTPNSGCLWCNQVINPAKLQAEAQTQGERKAQRYVDEPDVAAPSVITLNAVGAAHAANDFLFYMTALMDPSAPNSYLRHMALSRETRLVAPRHDEDCLECGHNPHSRFGRGDARRLSTRTKGLRCNFSRRGW